MTQGERELLMDQMAHFRKLVVEPLDLEIGRIARNRTQGLPEAKTADVEELWNSIIVSG